ncbi:hypothetical protein [Pseudomonas sp. 1152_12]|uniref:hypothetical protein n=1 Tax=Pseudomonas sp. 1152_12 TaxID=2604455 RepID=UPI004063E687
MLKLIAPRYARTANHYPRQAGFVAEFMNHVRSAIIAFGTVTMDRHLAGLLLLLTLGWGATVMSVRWYFYDR